MYALGTVPGRGRLTLESMLVICARRVGRGFCSVSVVSGTFESRCVCLEAGRPAKLAIRANRRT
jgi:hypothetical protein